MSNIDLRIGAAFRTLVKQACADLTKVCPVIADYDTRFPFAVYTRTGITPPDSKDRYLGVQHASFSLTIWADDYEQSLHTAHQAAQTLGRYRGETAGFKITDVIVENAEETYNETLSAYGQTLYFALTYSPAE